MNIIYAITSYILTLVISILPFDSYTEGVTGYPQTFLPNQALSSNDKTISKLIYRGLFKYDIYGTLIPDLAETWSTSEDGIVYTIKLKDNQRWSNGKKITADDLIYTSYTIEDLNGVATDKIDDLTVRYTLPNKYSPFLSLLTVGIMPVNSAESDDPLTPITSGDFRVGRIDKSGDVVRKIVLVSINKKHSIKKLVFKYYSNDEELITASKLGEINAFMSSSIYSPNTLPNYTNHRFPLQGIYYALFFNLRNENMANLELRSSLAKVLDIKKLILDYGISVEGPISRSVFTNSKLDFDMYDESFKSNFAGKEITLTIPDTDTHNDLAKEIRDVWEDKLNLKVTIRRIPTKDMIEKVIQPANFEILLFGQEVGRDPDRYVVWHSTQKNYPGSNISGYENVRVDRALEEGRDQTDSEDRIVHYNEVQRVINEELPAIFLYHPYVNYYVSKYVDGIGQKYTFTYYDRFLDFSNWEKVKTN